MSILITALVAFFAGAAVAYVALEKPMNDFDG